MAHGKTARHAEWAEILARWRCSGASQRGFCRDEGISYSAFTYWRKKLAEHPDNTTLICVTSGVAGNSVIAGGAPIHVQIGVMRAEFSGTERDEAIVKVLRAMRDASCSSI